MKTPRKPDFAKVRDAMREASAGVDRPSSDNDIVFPGTVLLVAQRGEVLLHEAFGCRSLLPERTPLTADMVYDVSSLTKPLVTTVIAMNAVQKGKFGIDSKVTRFLQTFGTHGKDRIQVRHLLNHTSGYAAFYEYIPEMLKLEQAERRSIIGGRSGYDFILTDLYRASLEYPTGERMVYSDLGFIVLGHLLETVYGLGRLDKLAERFVFHPLQLKSTGFIDLEKTHRKGLSPVTAMIAPTEQCPWRERILCGEVHDPRAYAMGGIAGHSGLFSNAFDVHLIAQELLRCYHGQGTLVSKEVVRQFWSRDGMVETSPRALGWDMREAEKSSSGRYFTELAVGHLGYSGCSLWIDPERELEVILLSNRIHPSVENNGIRAFRPKIHDLVMETLGYGS